MVYAVPAKCENSVGLSVMDLGDLLKNKLGMVALNL